MAPTISAGYAALLGFVQIALALRVIAARRAERVALGTCGRPRLVRAVRAHANFTENVPLALLLITFVELLGSSAWLVHALALALIAARTCHALGIAREPEDFRYRIAGMVVTLSVIGAAGLLILLRLAR